jgi:hypothetical protein
VTSKLRVIIEVGKKERRVVAPEGKIAGRSWPIQFLIRRIAHHVMDHAWEMEDRDLTS